MKTDDDAFVRVDEILASLKTKTSDGLLYGLVSLDSKPQRDKDNKWYISTEVCFFLFCYKSSNVTSYINTGFIYAGMGK